jgi:hypothetical protein
VKYSEGLVVNDEVGIIGVKKKQHIFHKRKRGSCDTRGATSKMNKVLLEVSMRNVSMLTCCRMNCCQHFPWEKMLMFLRQEDWNLLFKDPKAYGLNIPRRLHTRGDMR